MRIAHGELVKRIKEKMISLGLHQGEPPSQFRDKAINEVAAELRINPKSIAGISLAPSKADAAEARADAAYTMQQLLQPLGPDVVLDDIDDYSDQQLTDDLQAQGWGMNIIPKMIEGLRRLRPTKPAAEIRPVVSAPLIEKAGNVVPLEKAAPEPATPEPAIINTNPDANWRAPQSMPLLYTSGSLRDGQNINREFRELSEATRNWRRQNGRDE